MLLHLTITMSNNNKVTEGVIVELRTSSATPHLAYKKHEEVRKEGDILDSNA
jgi:hypothetical protein